MRSRCPFLEKLSGPLGLVVTLREVCEIPDAEFFPVINYRSTKLATGFHAGDDQSVAICLGDIRFIRLELEVILVNI